MLLQGSVVNYDDIIPCLEEAREQGKIRFIGASAYGEEIPMKVMNREAFRTLKRLHEEIGSVIACSFAPCHMWYQGIDPIDALHDVGSVVRAVHVDDTIIHGPQVRERGLMDPGVAGRPAQRAWTFAPPGFGHDEAFWREFLSTLRWIGYDGALNIEVECPFLSVKEGLEKSAAFLKPILFEEADPSKVN